MEIRETVARAIYDGDWDQEGDASAKLFCEHAADRVLELPEISKALRGRVHISNAANQLYQALNGLPSDEPCGPAGQ